jgi:hypothetical protein
VEAQITEEYSRIDSQAAPSQQRPKYSPDDWCAVVIRQTLVVGIKMKGDFHSDTRVSRMMSPFKHRHATYPQRHYCLAPAKTLGSSAPSRKHHSRRFLIRLNIIFFYNHTSVLEINAKSILNTYEY